MGTKLYVGNLSDDVGSSDLDQLFSQYGSVQSSQVIQDRDTGRSKGFGFVEIGSESEAQAAIDGLHDQEHVGRRPRAVSFPLWAGQRGLAPERSGGACRQFRKAAAAVAVIDPSVPLDRMTERGTSDRSPAGSVAAGSRMNVLARSAEIRRDRRPFLRDPRELML